jgi:hypothetical protein
MYVWLDAASANWLTWFDLTIDWWLGTGLLESHDSAEMHDQSRRSIGPQVLCLQLVVPGEGPVLPTAVPSCTRRALPTPIAQHGQFRREKPDPYRAATTRRADVAMTTRQPCGRVDAVVATLVVVEVRFVGKCGERDAQAAAGCP